MEDYSEMNGNAIMDQSETHSNNGTEVSGKTEMATLKTYFRKYCIFVQKWSIIYGHSNIFIQLFMQLFAIIIWHP